MSLDQALDITKQNCLRIIPHQTRTLSVSCIVVSATGNCTALGDCGHTNFTCPKR